MTPIQPIKTNDPVVYEGFTRLLDEIQAEVFSLQQFINVIEIWRQKEMIIEHDNMPIGMTGYGIGLADYDLICTRPGLSYIQELGTKLHELWHFRRFDIPLLQNGENTATYAIFIKQKNKYKGITSKQENTYRSLTMYENPVERSVETLARLTLHRILQYERCLPKYIQYIYGYCE